jgi:hypothetical protein
MHEISLPYWKCNDVIWGFSFGSGTKSEMCSIYLQTKGILVPINKSCVNWVRKLILVSYKGVSSPWSISFHHGPVLILFSAAHIITVLNYCQYFRLMSFEIWLPQTDTYTQLSLSYRCLHIVTPSDCVHALQFPCLLVLLHSECLFRSYKNYTF